MNVFSLLSKPYNRNEWLKCYSAGSSSSNTNFGGGVVEENSLVLSIQGNE